MHSTEPVLRSGCYWISERGLAVWELQEGVIFVADNVCQLAVNDAGAFVEVPSHDDAHVFERQILFNVVLAWYWGQWCFS